MEYTIAINAQIGHQEFHLCETHEVDTEEWDIEGVAAESLELMTLRMKSAISPCFWDHAHPNVPGVYLPEEEKK